MQTNCLQCKFGEESWSILSEIEQSIKEKVEAIGIPLKDWDVEISRCKLLYTGWINNKVPLYCTGNYNQYPSINHNAKEYEKNI